MLEHGFITWKSLLSKFFMDFFIILPVAVGVCLFLVLKRYFIILSVGGGSIVFLLFLAFFSEKEALSSIEVFPLEHQRGLGFRVDGHWDVPYMIMYDYGWEVPHILDVVMYDDRSRVRITAESNPDDWEMWQKRYEEVWQELQEGAGKPDKVSVSPSITE